MTVNLNAEDYEGGDLRFPEYDMRAYRAPTGGAIVFSCSIMHEATAVTRGQRYAVLPFLYDEAAAELRRANLGHVADEALRAGGAGERKGPVGAQPAGPFRSPAWPARKASSATWPRLARRNSAAASS